MQTEMIAYSQAKVCVCVCVCVGGWSCRLIDC